MQSSPEGLIFLSVMETHTPTQAERFTIIREKLRRRLQTEGPRYNIARALDLLVLEFMTWMISLAVSRAERGCEPCLDDAGAEPEVVVAPGGTAAAGGVGGAECRGDADARHAGERVAGGTGIAAAGAAVVIDDATDEDCVPAEGGAHAACGCAPRGRLHLVAMAQGEPALGCGRPVLEGFFAKMGVMQSVEPRRLRCEFAMISDCFRGLRRVRLLRALLTNICSYPA